MQDTATTFRKKDEGKRYHGVTYFREYVTAKEKSEELHRAGCDTARVVQYERGFAVQLYKSGPYI